MSTRVSKKLVPSLQDISGALVMVNALDPQIATVKLFLEAVSDLPHFVVLNKVDLVSASEAIDIARELESDVVLASMLEIKGIGTIKKKILGLPKGTIAILGCFNAGKTSLINILTGEDNPVGDMPGTTLEFTEHHYIDRILLDTVGQIIDVSKPLMVSIDLSDCRTPMEKLAKCMREDASGIGASIDCALPGLEKALELIYTQVEKGKKVVVVGAGASALVAMSIAGQGQETGLPIMCFTNNFSDCQPVSFAKGLGETEMALAEYFVRAVAEGDAVVAVSASGGTGFTYAFLKLAKGKGAFAIAITENIDTPLGKAANIVIKSNAKPEGPSSSRIVSAHLAIGHALILTLADIRGVTAEQSIEFMLPSVVRTKRMGIK